MTTKDLNTDLDKLSQDANISKQVVVRPEEGTEPLDVASFSMGNTIDESNINEVDPLPTVNSLKYSDEQEDVALEPQVDDVFTGEKIDVAGKIPIPKGTKDLISKKKVIKDVDKAKPPLTTFNYTNIDSEEALMQHMEKLAQQKGYDKYKKVDFSTLQKELMAPEYAVVQDGKSVKVYKDKKRAEKYIADTEKPIKR